MTITAQEIRQRLDTDEPEYQALATIGPDALPHLMELVRDDDASLAAKAAYLASMIDADDALAVVEQAARSPHDTVRVAATAGLRNMAPERVAATVERMMDDADAGVRKQAITAAADLQLPSMDAKLRKVASGDAEASLRSVARQRLRQPEGDAAPKRAATKKRTATKRKK